MKTNIQIIDDFGQGDQILSATSTSKEIEAYFRKVLELSQSGEDFPVDLEEVWPLVYSEKWKAVNELKKTKNPDGSERYIHELDYQSINQKVEAGHTYATVHLYKLSLSCLEFFIARKVRPVFEVYRKIFHASLGQKPVEIKTLSNLDIAKMLVKAEEDKLLLESKNQELEYVVEVQEKKLENKSIYEDIGRRFVKTDETRAIQFVAKKHNMTSNEMNKFLESKGIQHKSKEGTWILNKPYDKKDYARLVELPCKNGYVATALEWTRSGESFISDQVERFNREAYKTQVIPISEKSSIIH